VDSNRREQGEGKVLNLIGEKDEISQNYMGEGKRGINNWLKESSRLGK